MCVSERVGDGEMGGADGLVRRDGVDGAVGGCGGHGIEKEGMIVSGGYGRGCGRGRCEAGERAGGNT